MSLVLICCGGGGKIKRKFFVRCRKSRYNGCKLGGGGKSYFGIQINQLLKSSNRQSCRLIVIVMAGQWVGVALREQRRSEGAGNSVCGFTRCLQQQTFAAGPVATRLGSITSAWPLYHGKKKFSQDHKRKLHQNSLLPASHCFHMRSTSKPPRTSRSSTKSRASCFHPKQKSTETCSSLLASPTHQPLLGRQWVQPCTSYF